MLYMFTVFYLNTSALHSAVTELFAVCRTAVALKHNYDDGRIY